MTYSEKLKQVTMKEWRELGFYYDQDDKNQWRIIGSKNGLLNFSKILDEYIVNPKNKNISEHEHYGPYSYLKIMTWNEPIIKEDVVGGTLSDLNRLSKLIKMKLKTLEAPADFVIDKDYCDRAQWKIKFIIKKDDFDPSSEDPQLK